MVAGILISLLGLVLLALTITAVVKEVEIPGLFKGSHDKSQIELGGALGVGATGVLLLVVGVLLATRTGGSTSAGAVGAAVPTEPSPATSSAPSTKPPDATSSPTAQPSSVPSTQATPGPPPWAYVSNNVRAIVERATKGTNGLVTLAVRLENDGGFSVGLANNDIHAVDDAGQSVYFSDQLSTLPTYINLSPGRETTGTLVTVNPILDGSKILELRLDVSFGGGLSSTYVRYPITIALPM